VQEVPLGPPDQVWRLERYRQEHPEVDIHPPGTESAVWRAFRDENLIAYGFTLMVFLDRLETLPEPLGVAQHFGFYLLARRSPCPAAGSPRRGAAASGMLNRGATHTPGRAVAASPGLGAPGGPARIGRSPAGSRLAASRRRPAAGQTNIRLRGA
jgi:hypothetical protein